MRSKFQLLWSNFYQIFYCLVEDFPHIVLMMITCLMYDSVVCGHAHENLLQSLFAPRANYIHLMREFVSRPDSLSIVYKMCSKISRLRDMCVKRFKKLFISQVITYNGTSPPKVVHKSCLVDNCSFECEKKSILGVETMKM